MVWLVYCRRFEGYFDNVMLKRVKNKIEFFYRPLDKWNSMSYIS
jgi:hypothetical protein